MLLFYIQYELDINIIKKFHIMNIITKTIKCGICLSSTTTQLINVHSEI